MELNEGKRKVLWALAVLIKKFGYSPSFRELCAALNVTSTNAVVGPLSSLRDKSLVKWEPGKSRTLRLTEEGWKELVGPDLVKECARVRVNVLGRLRYLDE